MKIQLNTELKTVKIEGNVKLSDLVKHLESLLPKDCKLGYWKDYELECNTVITYWSNPIVIKEYTNPWWVNPYNIPYYTTGTDTTGYTITNASNNSVYNIELN